MFLGMRIEFFRYMYQKVLNVLLISNEEKSHVFIKDFNRLIYSKTEHKEKNTFVCHVYKILLLKKY